MRIGARQEYMLRALVQRERWAFFRWSRAGKRMKILNTLVLRGLATREFIPTDERLGPQTLYRPTAIGICMIKLIAPADERHPVGWR